MNSNSNQFEGLSQALANTLADEILKAAEDPENEEQDTEIVALQAMQRISKRIENGEEGLYDPLNSSDELALALARF